MDIIDIINKKRLGGELTKEEIDYVITNFTNKVISKHNVEYEQQNDLNKLDSLVTRLSLNGLTREEYYELRDLMSKYKNQINQQESINYEKIIDENQSKIR